MNGMVIYRGPSLLNGAPVIAICILKSWNEKTGPDSAQTYILPDGDERPTLAIRTGADAAVCGDCKHRPLNAGTCYVVVRQGATKVWDAYRRGLYPDFSGYVDVVSECLRTRVVRLGSYGDPAAVPAHVWRDLTRSAAGAIGYTHQWRAPHAQELCDLCMASVDSPAEMAEARLMGWRTFRVRVPGAPVLAGEAVCPASAEAGHKLTCSTCGHCNGTQSGRRGNVVIALHGNNLEHRAVRFQRAQEAA